MQNLYSGTKYVTIDMKDAPEGYHPVPKDIARPSNNLLSPNRNENVCKHCDYRPDCSKAHPCMSYDRADKISVVFKKLPSNKRNL